MNYRFVIKICIFIIFLAAAGPASPETVYLKDGQVLKGSIVSEDNETISLKTPYQSRIINRNHILRIMYGKSDMESIYLHLKDGRLVNGFLVDQDSDRIIFRKDKNSPDEESIPKKEIRQMSGEEIKLLYPDISFSSGVYYPLNSGGASLSPSPAYFIGSGFNFTPVDNIRLLFETGYIKSYSSDNENRYFQFIPFTINALYSIRLPQFKLVPRAGIGAAVVKFNDGEGGKFTGYDFTASIGAGASYRIMRTGIIAALTAEYNIVLEGNENLGSLILRAGVNYRF